jgi:hypothetical protein
MNMRTKILSMLDTTTKKVAAIALCGALVVAIGAGTVFAASSMNSLQVKVENGVRTYSTDGGKTWSKNAPDGVVVSDKDGKLTITNGIPPKDGEGNGMLSKMEDGVRTYSTDGGKTWSKNAPDGVVVSDKDGKLTITNGIPPKDGEGNGILSKMEDGVRYYSTDGGKTWSQKAPEGVTVSDKDGKLTITNGTPPKDGEGNGMLSKMEDGVRYYSTDGGKTWTQNAPKGVKVNEDGSVIANYN